MRASQLLAAVAALTSTSAAFSNVLRRDMNALAQAKNVLYGRQDSNSASDSSQPEPTAAPQSTASAQSNSPTATRNSDESQTTAFVSGSGSGNAQNSGATRTTTRARVTNFGNDVPAGGIQMVTPGPFAGTQYYKIGDWVTFAWNYTSLSITPSYIDVMASCTANQATYTIAVNQSVQATGKVLWDTGAYQQEHQNNQLFTEMYTLLIYDAQSSVSAVPRPGYLATYNQLPFGLYQKQAYTPWADFKCANCSGALSAFETLTLKALLITSCTTVASLLYFTASFGVW